MNVLLPAMFGPVMSQNVPASGPKRRVVGHERARRQDLVEHRVPAVLDVEHRLVDEHRPDVVARRGQFGQRREHVERREHLRGVQQPRRLRRDLIAHRQEQLQFQRLALVLRGEDLLLVLLQLRRDVALGVLERLAVLVVRGRLRLVGVGDLDVVAEDLVVADLQAGDAGPRDLLGLEAGDPVLAVGRERPQFVQFGVVALADDAAFLRDVRRVVLEGRVEQLAQVGAQFEPLLQVLQQRRPCGRRASP